MIATPTVVRSLFEEARKQVILTSYVFHKTKQLFEPLARRMDEDAQFQVKLITDLSPFRKKDESIPVLTNRFRMHFQTQIWPGKRLPDIWYYPDSLKETDRSQSGVMHAKTVIIDDRAALVTSANFTEAAQERNIEVGVLLRHFAQVGQLRSFFEGFVSMGQVVAL